MAALRFQVAGLAVAVTAPPPVMETLEVIYQLFPRAESGVPDLQLEWQGRLANWSAGPDRAGIVQVLDPAFRPQITTILIARLLAESRPDLFLLHGNALLTEARTLVFLLGDSGVGKTTLTRQLLEHHPGWRFLAEDTIMLDGPRRRALPFPRAAALREAGPDAAVTWGPVGAPGPAKLLEAPEVGRLATEDQSLEGAQFVLLEREEAPAEPRPDSDGSKLDLVWATYGDEALAGQLRVAGLPLRDLRLADQVACFRFDRSLGLAERLRLECTLEAVGSVILHIESSCQSKAWRGERPPTPRIEMLTPAQGVHGTLKHIRRQSVRQAAKPSGLTFIRLAQALSECRFHLLVPGGTIENTRETLEQVLLA